MIGPRWMIGRPSESAPRPAERPADAPVQGVARSHGKPAASGRISAPSDGREWMSHNGYDIMAAHHIIGEDTMRIDLDAAQIEMLLEGLLLSAQAREREGNTAQAEDIRDLADELERMLSYIRDTNADPLIY